MSYSQPTRQLSPGELRAELERRLIERARTSFAAFCALALPGVAQDARAPAAHHRLLISALQWVDETPNARLMVMMPPGSAKSTYGTVLFPAWAMRRAGARLIGASHTGDLADTFSRRVQGVVRDHAGTLGFGLENERADRWRTTNGGEYVAAGVGKAVAGTRASCFVAGTLVQTPAGAVPIECVAVGSVTGSVLSYDQAPSYRRVIAVARRNSDDIWRLRAASGRVVEATGDHRFFTQRGWIATASLRDGDVLLRSVRRSSVAGSFDTKTDPVSVVERLHGRQDVYDIQVDGTHCFFAGGLLAHNCAIIDDPVKSAEHADSEVQREATWKWFASDLRTRLKPDAKLVLIMTRWHQDDLAGRILEHQRDLWRIIKLPAIADEGDLLGREPGEFLWADDAYGYADLLRRTRDEMLGEGNARAWSSLYQQEPRPAEGLLFRADRIVAEPAAGFGGKLVRAWDLAATIGSKGDPDWTCGVKMRRDVAGRFWIEDVVRMRGGPEQVEATIKATAAADGKGVVVGLPQDPGQAGKGQVLAMTRMLAGWRVVSSPETGSKETRASPVAAQVNGGNVAMVMSPWNAALVEELRDFPTGRKDDQVDAVSRAFAMLVAAPAPAKFAPTRHMVR